MESMTRVNGYHFETGGYGAAVYKLGGAAYFECVDWGPVENAIMAAIAFAKFGGKCGGKSIGRNWFDERSIVIDFERKEARLMVTWSMEAQAIHRLTFD